MLECDIVLVNPGVVSTDVGRCLTTCTARKKSTDVIRDGFADPRNAG
jgi:hypothetical protein